MFRRVLIGNRGEIAVRVIRTLREMGITSIAAFSDADRDALFVQEADEAYRLGPPPAAESYLNVSAILQVAHESRAEAVHPGYGFLAENAEFASSVRDAGLTFIGPTPEAIGLMGDKVGARRAVEALGVPIVPGTPGPVESVEEALAFVDSVGFPVAVKASGGGGGRGIRVVQERGAMAEALERARREAETHFGNPAVYLEKYFPDPRHVEIQILADQLGHLVHLGERDCSVQRRHQKLVEETPSPAVDRALRERMGEMARRAAKAAGYTSAGTVEFLLSREGVFYFLEMNTRIQVEHPITEVVAGVDLIREMVLAAAGEPISVKESLLDPLGHAIEVRVNAENPIAGFRPTPGPITRYREPGGIGIRVDSGVFQGFSIPRDYDSLMAKVISWAPDRELSRVRMLRALQEYRIDGPNSTIPFAAAVLNHPTYVGGEVGTTFVENTMDGLLAMVAPPDRSGPVEAADLGREDVRTFEVEVNRRMFRVKVAELRGAPKSGAGRQRRTTHRAATVQDNVLASPMHGTVLSVKMSAGEEVQEGETVFIIEAMKMENEIGAHRAGTLASISVDIGDTVETGQQLAVIS